LSEMIKQFGENYSPWIIGGCAIVASIISGSIGFFLNQTIVSQPAIVENNNLNEKNSSLKAEVELIAKELQDKKYELEAVESKQDSLLRKEVEARKAISDLEKQLEQVRMSSLQLSKSLNDREAENHALRELADVSKALSLVEIGNQIAKQKTQIELKKQNANIAAILDTSDVQNLMAPFFTKSLDRVTGELAGFKGQPRRYNSVDRNRGTEKLPMSLTTINGSGALNDTDLGRKQLVALARVTNDGRPNWTVPQNAEEWDRIKKAQTLLKEYGFKMVELGYLRQ